MTEVFVRYAKHTTYYTELGLGYLVSIYFATQSMLNKCIISYHILLIEIVPIQYPQKTENDLNFA